MDQDKGDSEKECLYHDIGSKYLKVLEFRDYQKCTTCNLNGDAKNCSASELVDPDKKESILEDKLKISKVL